MEVRTLGSRPVEARITFGDVEVVLLSLCDFASGESAADAGGGTYGSG